MRHGGRMTLSERMYLALADFILVTHGAFVAFVVIGLVAIWVGWWRAWRFIRNRWLRLAHLTAICIVAAQALGGRVCPLTEWENQLRVLAGGGERYVGSFLQHWLHQVLFLEFSEGVFTVAYLGFFALVALSLWLVPPVWRTGKPARSSH
jgi:hypothetical protein